MQYQGTLSPVQSDLTYQYNCLQELLAQSILCSSWNTYLNCSIILLAWYLDMPHYCGLNILTICCLVDNCVAPYTLLHVHSFTVIVSYLGLGQPPLQLPLNYISHAVYKCIYYLAGSVA